jgi:hypothetical protein
MDLARQRRRVSNPRRAEISDAEISKGKSALR